MSGHPNATVRVLSVHRLFRPAFSGEGEWWLRMIPYLRARGIDVAILASRCHVDGDVAERESIDGVPVFRVGRPHASNPYRSFLGSATAFMLRQRASFDVALFHGAQGDTQHVSCLLGRLGGWKTVHKMTLYPWGAPLALRRQGRLGPLRFRLLGLADGYISISGPLTRAYAEAGFPLRKLLATTQAVDPARFAFDPAERRQARARLGIPPGAHVVLFVGAVRYLKGVDILLEAWRRVVPIPEDARLVLVGPTATGDIDPSGRRFAETLAEAMERPELRDTVRLVGFTAEVEPYYAAADLFVFPSRWEGFPNVLLEAMAAGLPCIVSGLEGLSAEVITPERDGVIVDSPDPEAYAFHILRLLKDRDLASELGRRAQATVTERFGMERVADAYAAFLGRLVGS